MLYCEKCMLLCEDACPNSADKIFKFSEHKIREVRENDPVFVTRLDKISAGLYESALKDNGIPYMKEGVLGAGLTVEIGDMLENYKFYVPYGMLEKANDIVAELFTAPDDETTDEINDEESKNDGI